jgi:ATP-binding protein involved in chromosome partitioning
MIRIVNRQNELMIPKGLVEQADLPPELILQSLNVNIGCINEAVKASFPTINNVIGISSGKGGVGKSTVCVNLAIELSKAGARVGILDADIYGPSIPTLFSVAGKKAESSATHVHPVMVDGIALASIGFLVEPDQALAWRGPMATGALLKLIQQTQWPDLDYLLIDMPPGTGDIQLTLAQKVPMTAALVVTTPHALSLADASKGINLFKKVEVPVLGIIENMASVECEKCGHEQAIFSGEGASSLARQVQTEVLASLPLEPSLFSANPVRSERSDIACKHLARMVALALLEQSEQLKSTGPEIEF